MKEATDAAGKIIATMMIVDIVLNETKYPKVNESYRKVCSFMAKKFGLSPPDMAPMLKTKVDALVSKAATLILTFVCFWARTFLFLSLSQFPFQTGLVPILRSSISRVRYPLLYPIPFQQPCSHLCVRVITCGVTQLSQSGNLTRQKLTPRSLRGLNPRRGRLKVRQKSLPRKSKRTNPPRSRWRFFDIWGAS